MNPSPSIVEVPFSSTGANFGSAVGSIDYTTRSEGTRLHFACMIRY